ncbi:hypothetical protein [Methylotetracoccus oryzae]|nr:hypothetical protein [Methylotetracoccus oryzae]
MLFNSCLLTVDAIADQTPIPAENNQTELASVTLGIQYAVS